MNNSLFKERKKLIFESFRYKIESLLNWLFVDDMKSAFIFYNENEFSVYNTLKVLNAFSKEGNATKAQDLEFASDIELVFRELLMKLQKESKLKKPTGEKKRFLDQYILNLTNSLEALNEEKIRLSTVGNEVQDLHIETEGKNNQLTTKESEKRIKINFNTKDLAYLFFVLRKQAKIECDNLGKVLGDSFINDKKRIIKNTLFNKYFAEFEKNEYPLNARLIDEFVKELK